MADTFIALPRGPEGPVGPQGPAGLEIRTGSGAPSSGLGVDNDLYLDTSNGDVYKKISGVWVFQVNLTGATGPTGPTGPAGPAGTPGTQVLLQRGSTLIDQSLAAGQGNTTINIPLDRSDYQFGTMQLQIPNSGTYSVAINQTRRRIQSTIYFTTTLADAHALSVGIVPDINYGGYNEIQFRPWGFNSALDSALSDGSWGANGDVTAGLPSIHLVSIVSCRINGANIEIVVNKSTAPVTSFIARADWRVWRVG